MTRALLALSSTLALAACAVGPNYVAPASKPAATAPLITSSKPAATAPLITSGAPVAQTQAQADWWRLYDDPVLDGLIADALAANTDLRVALARLDRARASLRGARADRLPSTSIQTGATYGRYPEIQRLPGFGAEQWRVDGGLSVGYEVDLFGRVSRNIEAARGDLGAATADADAVRVAVVADTTRAYVDAAAAAQRLTVAERVVGLLDNAVRVTGRRFEVGRAQRLDVARITTLRDQRRAEIPQIQADRQAALFRLATLTGRESSQLPETASLARAAPGLRQAIPIGDGAALLARRPDIRAAERRLAASTARIGVATADLYPKITLGGSVGSTGTSISDIFGGGPFRWLLGPLISWNFPNMSAARARIAEAKADSSGALASFDGTVLRALEETNTALSNYARALDRRRELTSAQTEADRAVRIIRARGREGTVDFLDVIDAERTDAEAQAALADADTRVADAQVDLFRALGGGWETAKRQP